MKTAATVSNDLANWISSGLLRAEIVVKLAEDCMGWPYVWGGYGQECTPGNRESFYNRPAVSGKDKENIKDRCQVLSGKASECAGCSFYPGGKTLFFDCRGFVRWVFGKVGVTISGAGATSQWNTDSNWTQKGALSEMPDCVCCVFQRNGTKMQHVGIHIGGGNIIHCSGTVKRGKTTDKYWSHYAIPKGMDGTMPTTDKPTLRKGSRGVYVTLMQSELINQGYTCGGSGADGIFGKDTEDAVKRFQRDHNLKDDGLCGPATWEALDGNIQIQLYTVHIPALPLYKAEALVSQYTGAWMTKEDEANA